MKTFDTGAKKDSSGKLPYELITKEMMDALAEALQLGIDKGYSSNNWQNGLPIASVSVAASLRHIFKYLAGEDMNVEVGKEGQKLEAHHLSCAMVNLGMAITQIKRGREDLDDRFKGD